MPRKISSPLPPDVDELNNRIAEWRGRRANGEPMPEELWTAAAALAGTHGAGRICGWLNLCSKGLKKRTGQPRAIGPRATEEDGGFVELDPRQIFGAFAAAGPVVDVCVPGGARLTVRLASHDRLDVPALIGSFLGRRP